MPESKKFFYRTHLKWVEAKKGLLSAGEKPGIVVATPPEFRGHQGVWTPEELFVASVNCCIMTTFLYFAEKGGLKFNSFESFAEGILERKEQGLVFSTVKVAPRILLASVEEAGRAEKVLGLTEKSCLISNSIKSKIIITPEIKAIEENPGE